MAFFFITIGILLAVLGIAIFTQFEMSDKQYDRLKWLILRWSVLTTFIGLVVKTFNVPYGIETVTIASGLGALIAGLLGISAFNYYVNGEQNKVNEDSMSDMLEDYYEEENDVSK